MGTQYQPDTLRGHPEDADGIEEYDNMLPRWWIGLFILTIIWGVWVMVDWHVISPTTLVDNFKVRAAELGLLDPPDLNAIVVNTDDPASVANGEQIFLQLCAVCHEADGSGNIGPSLNDDEWRYDGSIEGIVESIALGRPNGMREWYSQVGAEGVGHVAAYVAQWTDAQPRAAAGEDQAAAPDEAPAPDAPAPDAPAPDAPALDDPAVPGAVAPDAPAPDEAPAQNQGEGESPTPATP